jgi:hypothetical protein
MSDDQFTRLFKYMESRFDSVDEKFIKADRDMADIRGSVAELSARVEDYHNEVLILSHQFDRLQANK